MTLILLEGPDQAGKTTLARAITQPEFIVHSTYVGHDLQEEHTMDNFIRGFNFSRKAKVTAVLDRGWIGQDVYAAMFRPHLPNATWTKHHHHIALACKCYTVLCAPDPAKVEEAFQAERDRGEMYKSTFEVAKLYRYLATCLGPSQLNFDPQRVRSNLFHSVRDLPFRDLNYTEQQCRNRAILPGFGFYDRFAETPEHAARRILSDAMRWEKE